MTIPTLIKQMAHKVRTEIKGKDVRESLARSMEVTGETAEEARKRSLEQTERVDRLIKDNPQPSEVVDARGKFDILSDRLNESDSYLDQAHKFIGQMPRLGSDYRDIVSTIVDREVNAKDFGVKADGTNETSQLQSAINHLRLTGGTVLIPAGRVVAKGLKFYPNVRLKGVGKSSILSTPSSGGYMFLVRGSVGDPIKLSEDAVGGDSLLQLSEEHNLNVNDDILVTSQRDCLSSDGGQWRLGVPTPGVRYAYFGEFKKVKSSPTPNEVLLSSPLFFPSYFKDNTRESSRFAGESATIQKVNFMKNVVIEDLTIEGELAGVANFQHAYNCCIRNVDWIDGHEGAFVTFKESLKCYGENLNVEYNYSKEPSEHYKRNAYKVISSHLCGFTKCKADNATQAADFTFEEGKICTAFAYLNDSDIMHATDNAATSHGGTYASQFLNNRMISCRKGISTRSRNSIITGNVITGYRTLQASYGVSIYDGWARDCVVSENIIVGFGNGVEVTEKEDGKFDYVGLTVSQNKIQECLHGVWLRRHSTNKYIGESEIKIVGNTINKSYEFGSSVAKLIRIDSYYHGVEISNNSLIVNNSANGAIYLSENASNIRITFNKFLSATNNARSVWIEKPTDTDLFPDGKIKAWYFGNEVVGLKKPDSEYVNFSMSSRDIYGILPPGEDNVFSLGHSTKRWSTVWAATGVSSTSDRNYKQQITEIPDEVLDAWADVEYVQFKFNEAVETKGIEGARWHVGVIAQKIEEAFKEHGLDAFEYGLIGLDKFENEWNGDELIRPAGEIYSIRADECQFLEMALMRRELRRLKEGVGG